MAENIHAETAAPGAPPVTGLPGVDRATAGLTELEGLPLSAHPDRLLSAHTALVEALNADPMGAESAVQRSGPDAGHPSRP